MKIIKPNQKSWMQLYSALPTLFWRASLRSATEKELAQLGFDISQAWAKARENLLNFQNDLQVIAENQGVKIISADSGLATGNLWLLCEQEKNQNFDSMVINRDSYMFAKMGNDIATATLASIASNFVGDDNTLSENVISCIDGKLHASRLEGNSWIPIEP